jgi:hypothetical protein
MLAPRSHCLPLVFAVQTQRRTVLDVFGNANVSPDPDNDTMRFWHKHIWGEWERAWGKGSPKDYVLERKCSVCGKTQTQVIR